jgi:hypothetical protein
MTMAKTINIILGDDTFEIRKFNIGQHERLADIFQLPSYQIPKAVLALALESATPSKTSEETNSLLCDGVQQLSAAVSAILQHSGYKPKEGDKPEKSETATAA